MEKRGSKYLRCTLFNGAKYAANWNPIFGACLAKKRAEDKHYSIAIFMLYLNFISQPLIMHQQL